jgi:hypothetical protein
MDAHVRPELGNPSYLVHTPVHRPIYLDTSCSFIHEAENFPVRPQGASVLSPSAFPPSLPPALAKEPVKESV